VVLLLGAGFGLVVAPLGETIAIVVGAVMTVLLALLLLGSARTVAVRDGLFTAGRARIPVGLLGEPEILDTEGMRVARGPGLDARAYLYLSPWIAPGVRVAVTDAADPTPYWLVSTRHPGRLADALGRARRV
jgi:hypothetical protein